MWEKWSCGSWANRLYFEAMRKYELTLVARTVEGVAEKIEKVVKVLGGKVGKSVEMGKKPLAYHIRKAGEGHYLQILIELPGKAVVELVKKLNVEKEVLRHLLVKEIK